MRGHGGHGSGDHRTVLGSQVSRCERSWRVSKRDEFSCETILICEIDLILLFEQNPLFTFGGYFGPLPSAGLLLPPTPGHAGAGPHHRCGRRRPVRHPTWAEADRCLAQARWPSARLPVAMGTRPLLSFLAYKTFLVLEHGGPVPLVPCGVPSGPPGRCWAQVRLLLPQQGQCRGLPGAPAPHSWTPGEKGEWVIIINTDADAQVAHLPGAGHQLPSPSLSSL